MVRDVDERIQFINGLARAGLEIEKGLLIISRTIHIDERFI